MAITRTRTDVGPLTTIFTPSPACTSLTIQKGPFYPETTTDYAIVWGATCDTVPGVDQWGMVFAPTCVPSPLAQIYHGFDQSTVALFSPGLHCPSGFTQACTISREPGDKPPPPPSVSSGTPYYNPSSDIWNVLQNGETAVGCCLSGYECDPKIFDLCVTTPTPNAVVSGVFWGTVCSEVTPSSITFGPSPTQSEGKGPRINMIVPQGGLDGGVGGGDLSTGAKAGIGIVITFFALLAIGIGVYFVLRKQQNRSKDSPTPEISTLRNKRIQRPVADPVSMHEVDNVELRHELESYEQRHEMPTPGQNPQDPSREHENFSGLLPVGAVSQHRASEVQETTADEVASTYPRVSRVDRTSANPPQQGRSKYGLRFY